MENNGSNKAVSDYYLGLDVGTNSVGWAVTNKAYDLLKCRGNTMWGVRLFEEAKDASERRSSRTARRLAARAKQRLSLLELLFSEELGKKDPLFLTRIAESALYDGDKTESASKYSVFNDTDFTDKDYFKRYPTVYHLRKELIDSSAPHDIRLVYLALHHIIKSRGHFLFDMEAEEEYKNVNEVFDELCELLLNRYAVEMNFLDKERFLNLLLRDDMNISNKKKEAKALLSGISEGEIDVCTLLYALVGAAVKFADLFRDETLRGAEPASFSLRNDFDENYDKFEEAIGERIDLVVAMKNVFDAALLSRILGGSQSISEAKVALFESNKADLALLKCCVKELYPSKYKYIFCEKKEKLDNFAAYGKRTLKSGEYRCTQEAFCKFLEKELPDMQSNEKYAALYGKIERRTFLPKLKGPDNSVIPNQLHYRELKKILQNASEYLPFLNTVDADGLTVKEKILCIFTFRIPYYVGPLNESSPNAWVIRSKEKITPWNFEKVVDTQQSAKKFIINLIGKCTYTGEEVLPKDSLLYSEFTVLNEMNPLCMNGDPVPAEVKNRIIEDLFVKSNGKVTKRKIKDWLLINGYAKETDEISGVDDILKSKLKSYHDFKKILDKTKDSALVEEIIKNILIFGDDKKMLKSWLKANCGMLDDKDIAYILRLKYKDWGRLSRVFLTEIHTPGEDGEALSVIDMLRGSNKNLMQLLSDEYYFAKNAEAYRLEKFGSGESLTEQMEEMYISPRTKRSIRQTLKIVKEIASVQKSAPQKIFIEVARGTKEDLKGKRTVSRKERLMELYKACKEEYGALKEALDQEDEGRLRHNALYLYYTQFGRCMYTGECIDITKIDMDYDVDHIYPQSRIKDDSLDNTVLVKREKNIEKGNVYPIKSDIQSKMRPFWKMLKEKGLISGKKYERLIRTSPLTDAELSAFVSRQLVETQQSTKALASILKRLYPDTKIVYSKAGNVSDFRHMYDLIKCREVNDLHHAKDAYLNIVVGNVYDTKFTEAFFRNISREHYSLNRVFDFDVKGAWERNKSICKVIAVMKKNNILVTRMSYEAKGQLFDLQIMQKGKGQLSVKEGMDIGKYGGYNKVAGTYFFVAEHTKGKKRIRTVEPVFLYKKALYETDPVKYCTEILGLVDPVIICGRILIDSLLSLDGREMYITGRSGNQILGKHNYQLAVGYENEKSIKAVAKYIGRCMEKKAFLPITSYDGISAEENVRLYDLFLSKLHTPVYFAYFSGIYEVCEAGRSGFTELSVYDQCVLLLELLKIFKCDRTMSDLSLIGGPKTTGGIQPVKNLSNCNSAYLINRSVTGLYTYRVNLLGS